VEEEEKKQEPEVIWPLMSDGALASFFVDNVIPKPAGPSPAQNRLKYLKDKDEKPISEPKDTATSKIPLKMSKH